MEYISTGILIGILWTIVVFRWSEISESLKRILHWGRDFDKAGNMTYSMKALVEKVLGEMECQIMKNEDKGDGVSFVSFRYKGLYYNALITNGTPRLMIKMPCILEAPQKELVLVRSFCNTANLNSRTVSLLYAFNLKTGMYDVHIATNQTLTPSGGKAQMKDILDEMVFWRDNFHSQYMSTKEAFGENPYIDLEAINDEQNRYSSIMLEHEMMGSQQQVKPSDNHPSLLAVGDILPCLFRVHAPDYLSLHVSGKEGEQSVQKEDIATYQLSQLAGVAADADNHASTAVVTFCAEEDKRVVRTMSIIVNDVRPSHDAMYYRLTAVVTPKRMSREAPLSSADHAPQAKSVVIATAIREEADYRKEAHFMWEEAMGLLRQGKETELTDNQRDMLSYVFEPTGAEYYRGRSLFLQHRYAEALPHLLRAYRERNLSPSENYNEDAHSFFKVLYMIGTAYSDLRQYEQAIFFLEQLPVSLLYTTEYINALVNSNDRRALSIIEAFLQKVITNDDEEYEDDELVFQEGQRETFINFLRRRKVQIFMRTGREDDARKILSEMLTEEENMNFALSAMAFLEKKEGKKPSGSEGDNQVKEKE